MCEAVGHRWSRSSACVRAAAARRPRGGPPPAAERRPRSSGCAAPPAIDSSRHAAVRPSRRRHRRGQRGRRDPRARPSELMRELLERNELDSGTSSAASSRSPPTSTPSSRRSRRGSIGLEPRPAAVRPRDPRPGRAAARDPRADPLLPAGGHRAPARVPRRGAGAAAGPRRRAVACAAMALEFAEQGPAHPRLPGRRRLRAAEGTSRCSPPTSRPSRRCRRSSRRSRARSPALNRYPDPTNAELRGALADRYGVPAEPDRDRQRLVRRPAGGRRGAARAGRRDRLRLAVVLGLPAPGGRLRRPGDRGAARRRAPPRPRGDAARDHGRHAAGDRLQPEQPDLDGAAARRDRRVRRPMSRATCA